MKIPKDTAKLHDIVEFYYQSTAYRRVSGKTQKDYAAALTKVCDTVVEGRELGRYQAKRIRVRHLQQAYDIWLNTGVRTANYRRTALGTAWRNAMRYDILVHDPVKLVQAVSSQPRRVKWEREHVKQFLEVAYSDFNWRSIGLIVHMAYDWGQRVGDMRMLTWDTLDLDTCRIDMTQSKRHAEVHLPISKNLCAMLRLQKEALGFQQYVAPKVLFHSGETRPYTLRHLAQEVNKIKDLAGIPKELTAMDLRRTAVTEMMEGGVDLVGIMQVTGHMNVNSVKHYMVNTYSGASKALAARGNEDDE